MALDGTSGAGGADGGRAVAADPGLAQIQAHLRLLAQQPAAVPSIYRRLSAEEREELKVWETVVAEWGPGRRARAPTGRGARGAGAGKGDVRRQGSGGRPAGKSKPSGARIYTSRFRGVHQTFPTKRYEAQFRRSGKPTSLGCFDTEEQAARAYDKMMLWCMLHSQQPPQQQLPGGDAAEAAAAASPAASTAEGAAAAGVPPPAPPAATLWAGASRTFTTNFDASAYVADLPWLQSIDQDALIEQLRSEGRRQAAHRTLPRKRESPSDDGGEAALRLPLASGGGMGGDGGVIAAAEEAAPDRLPPQLYTGTVNGQALQQEAMQEAPQPPEGRDLDPLSRLAATKAAEHA